MSTLISPYILSRVRRMSERLRPEMIEVWRNTNAKASGGGTTQTYARVASMPGRIAGSKEAEAEVAERLGIIRPWVATLPHNADVRIDDRLKANGRTFEVKGDSAGRSYAIHQRVVCQEVSGN